MKNLKKSKLQKLRRVLLLSLTLVLFASGINAGVPVTGLLLCCRGNDRGTFLINGQQVAQHNYRDLNQVRGILQDIKNAGINVVIIDMTNASMWVRNFDIFEPMIDNIRQVTAEKNMEYFIMTGIVLSTTVRNEPGMPDYLKTIDQVEFWNNIAQIIWNDYAPDPHYRTYGFGDNRKILGLFYPGELVFGANGNGGILNNAPASNKTFLSNFYLGTNEYNNDFVDTPTDGWGYRDQQQNSDGKIRFVSPTSGLHPDSSTRITSQEWSDRIDWAAGAEHYSVYGSYDDSFDNIHWGINDTQNATTSKDIRYPGNDPYYYYNILKDKLTSSNNTNPVVSFTSPLSNTTFTAPANISVDVDATDDGSISNVKLYLDGILVRQEDIAPYQWGANDPLLNNMMVGTYELKATATDNDGASTTVTKTITVTSSTLSVNEIESADRITLYPSAVQNTLFISGDRTAGKAVTLYNILGAAKMSKILTKGENIIEMGTLSSGLYIVKITDPTDGSKSTTHKIVKLE